MEQFEDIRPYHDHEVRPTLDRILKDRNLLHVVARYQYPRLAKSFPAIMNWLTSFVLRKQLKSINDIRSLQEVIEPLITRTIRTTTSKVTYSGIENLEENSPYLFLSNHRDIVLDPALVNYALHHQKMETARIAIGDNLIKRPFVNDLMRLNKSFLVKRSVTGRREKLESFKALSAYIHHSIHTGHSVWIAQSEGRAKDGNDMTDTAIIKMIHMGRKGKDISFSDDIKSLNIVPVSISYEFDPCDRLKAQELQLRENHGEYIKDEDEDMQSIVKGIEGYKGHVHIAFGKPLNGDFNTALDVTTEVDRQIHAYYRLQPANLFAWEAISSELLQEFPGLKVPPLKTLFPNSDLEHKRQEFTRHLEQCKPEHRHWFLRMYANPVINQYQGMN